MQFFYEEQLHHMKCMAQEPVLLEDLLCQMVDMVGPKDANIVDTAVIVVPVLPWIETCDAFCF
ncbi:hypothetical protein HanRHA438_Chr06g0261441 [Helianthus annuus]|nr:hypothetical protein HanRHA438_Chr06g0261441 [Helianthus annuus]